MHKTEKRPLLCVPACIGLVFLLSTDSALQLIFDPVRRP